MSNSDQNEIETQLHHTISTAIHEQNFDKNSVQRLITTLPSTVLFRAFIRTLIDANEHGGATLNAHSIHHKNGYEQATILQRTNAYSLRAHFWHPRRQIATEEDIHDHPWNYTSLIISGSYLNETFLETLRGTEYNRAALILNKENGYFEWIPCGRCALRLHDERVYKKGDVISAMKSVIHRVKPSSQSLTISLILAYDTTQLHSYIYRTVQMPSGRAPPRKHLTHSEVAQNLRLFQSATS